MKGFALFDPNKTIVYNAKDISEYVAESIRNIYGVIVTINLDKYEGMTSKAIVKASLTEHGFDEKEITARLDRIMEDLPYSYYNVAWSDTVNVAEGAKELLAELKKLDVLVGIATGEAEKVSKMRLEKANLQNYFSFGSYGEKGIEMSDIIKHAVYSAESEFGIPKEKGVLVATSPSIISAGKALGIKVVGVLNNKHNQEELKSAGADTIVKSLKEKGKIISMLGI